MARIARDVCVHLYLRGPRGLRFLMLRRTPERGGFWQGVTGGPLPGEGDAEAAVREVREETGFDVRATLLELAVRYAHGEIPVVSFGAEAPGARPRLDPREHDAFAWCSQEEAHELLDWPIERDALAGRREALRELAGRLSSRA